MSSTRLLSRLLLPAAFCLAASFLHAEIGTWTNLDGQSMQAEFLARKGDYVSFRKDDGSKYLYPYAKLSATDRARVDALAAAMPAASAATVSEVPATPAASANASAPAARPGALATALAGKLVVVKNGSLAAAPREQLNGAKYLAFYYSAHWCPPCRGFTPDLVEAYKSIKAKHPEFELVFVSSDRTPDAMKGYMTEYGMAWPAVKFDAKGSTSAIRRPGHERGIPNLVFMDADGKELSVSYTRDGDYLGPQKVLRDIQKHFKM